MAKENNNNNNGPSDAELEWIKFREDTLGEQAFPQDQGRYLQKFKENPFVPIGAMTTVGALLYGLYCFKNGMGARSQTMMRWRVGAQGFTVLAILGGIVLGGQRNPAVERGAALQK